MASTGEHARFIELTTVLFEQNQFSIKYDLDAMRAALDLLDISIVAPVVALVAGTNGKGTVSSAAATMCTHSDVKTGLFTSPHLVDFRERMRVDGACIPVADCVRIGEDVVRRFAGRGRPTETPRPLSYFELTTLIGLVWFHEQRVDVAILEVGLGGRLDATNAVEHHLAAITALGLDHQSYLGNTLAEIAVEKAGVCRPGLTTYLHPAHDGHADALLATRAAKAKVVTVAGGRDFVAHNHTLAFALYEGIMARLDRFANPRLAQLRVRTAARQHVAHVAGRTLLLDGAHNPQSSDASARWLRESEGAPRVGIVGMSPGRDPVRVLGPMVRELERVIVTHASMARAVDGAELVGPLEAAFPDTRFELAPSPADALAVVDETVPTYVGGSLYLVGEVLAVLNVTAEQLPIEVVATPIPEYP